MRSDYVVTNLMYDPRKSSKYYMLMAWNSKAVYMLTRTESQGIKFGDRYPWKQYTPEISRDMFKGDLFKKLKEKFKQSALQIDSKVKFKTGSSDQIFSAPFELPKDYKTL